MQVMLSKEQLKAFYHDHFVDSQVNNFLKLFGQSSNLPRGVIVDVGGGCGYFAKGLASRSGFAVRVLDSDAQSIKTCLGSGLDARCENALAPNIAGDESVICFNLILHHLVGPSEAITLALQKQALQAWRGRASAIFVDEYIYDSFIGNFSGWFIYTITSSSFLSSIGRSISRFMPSLRANTFGVGVRFRSRREWVTIFKDLGFTVMCTVRGHEEAVSIPRRLLMISSCRRDSFLLRAAATHEVTHPS
jgi:hypothetical protein